MSISRTSLRRCAGFFPLFALLVVIVSSCSGGGSGAPLVALPYPGFHQTDSILSVSAVAGNGRVTLGWNGIANATSYNIYSSLSATQTGSIIASVNANSVTYVDTPVSNGTTYYYVIEALNGTTVLLQSSQVSATPEASLDTITISGVMQYQDKEYNANGFTGNQPYKAIRYASVELVSGNSVLLSTQTDSTGFYRITTAPTLTVYVRVQTAATPPGSPAAIEVNNLTGSIYAARGNDFLASGNAIVDISVPSTSIGGAFNILDVFTNGFEFVHTFAGIYPPSLTGYWQKNNSSGTYYCSGPGSGCSQGEGIYVLNTATDTDEYDDDVLYHEFGHFTAAHFSRDDSPGGAHMLTSNDVDLRLSWSEGWGDQMPGTIKMWLSSSGGGGLLSSTGIPLTEYVDTTSGGAGIAIDMDNPDGTYGYNQGYFSYASSEIAVAKILLDLSRDYAIADVWSVFADFLAHTPATPTNLELFWDRWHSLAGTAAKTVDSYFADRLIFYRDDSFEPDNDFASASTYTAQGVHYLYDASDADYVAFPVTSGRSYAVTTSNIRNGADTVMTVYRSDQTTVVAANDNTNGDIYTGSLIPSDLNPSLIDSYGVCHDNGSDILGSTAKFIAPSTGTYYVKVESSPNRPVSAGRYGTYTLTIQ